MSDRDEPERNLVPGKRCDVVPAGPGNPLVSRGLADLAEVQTMANPLGSWAAISRQHLLRLRKVVASLMPAPPASQESQALGAHLPVEDAPSLPEGDPNVRLHEQELKRLADGCQPDPDH